MAWQTLFGSTKTAGKWVDHIRRRVDFARIDADAKRDVQLVIAGPSREELTAALREAGEPAGDALRLHPSLPDPARLTKNARAAIYALAANDLDSWRGDSAAFPRHVYAVRPPGAMALETSPATPKKPTPGSPALYSVSALTGSELRRHLLPDVVTAYSGLEIPLAAQVPAFRPVVAARLTLNCAQNSLKIAAASALADHIPMIGLITGGIASAGDTIAITALQMRMLLQIAAAYGKKAEFARIIELLPVLGGGYGWRALAREASGFIPIAGIVIKAGIAYAGTVVVGQAASYYYETGSQMPSSAISALYREASERARTLAIQFAKRAGKKPGDEKPS